MYEAGYVRTKEGWKKVGGGKKEKADPGSNQPGEQEGQGEQGEDIDGQLQDHLESEDLNDDSMHDVGEPFSDNNIHPDLQQEGHELQSDLPSSPPLELNHDPQLQDDTPLDPGLQATHHDPVQDSSQHDQLQNGQPHPDGLSSEQLRQDQMHHQQLQEQLRQEHELRQRLQLPQNPAPPYSNSDAWRSVAEGTSQHPFGV